MIVCGKKDNDAVHVMITWSIRLRLLAFSATLFLCVIVIICHSHIVSVCYEALSGEGELLFSTAASVSMKGKAHNKNLLI